MNHDQDTKRIAVNERISSAFGDLTALVSYNFDFPMAFMVEVCASVIATLMLKDSTNPVGLILVDNPSTGKTTALSMFYDLPMVYRSDSFTAASFVSHASNRKKESLEKIDLLPRIQHKCLIVSELAPLFGQRHDDFLKSIAILTRVFDGEGYWCDSGVHGGRGYVGDYLFAMLGATPPFSKKVWKVMGQFGSRLLFLTSSSPQSPEERLAKSFDDVFFRASKSFKQRLQECKQAVSEYFALLTRQLCGEDPFARSVEWSIFDDPRELKLQISILAEFTACARSKVAVWESNSRHADTGRDFAQPLLEGSQRLATILYSLTRGHAVVNGRQNITAEDMPLIVEVALSSMPNDRRQVVDLLLEGQSDRKTNGRGEVSSSDIQRSLTISRPTALKIIDELALLGIGDKTEGSGSQACYLTLNPTFEWLTSDQFAVYRRTWRDQ